MPGQTASGGTQMNGRIILRKLNGGNLCFILVIIYCRRYPLSEIGVLRTCRFVMRVVRFLCVLPVGVTSNVGKEFKGSNRCFTFQSHNSSKHKSHHFPQPEFKKNLSSQRTISQSSNSVLFRDN